MILAMMRRLWRKVSRCPAVWTGGVVLVAGPVAPAPVVRRLLRLFLRILFPFRRRLNLPAGPVFPSSVEARISDWNLLWGGSPVNQGSCVNHLVGFQVGRPGGDGLHVYSNWNLGVDMATERFPG